MQPLGWARSMNIFHPPLLELSPLVRAIPENPLRALYPFAARKGMLNLASGHPSSDAYDLEGLAEATQRATADFSAWSYGSSAGDPELIAALASLSPVRPDGSTMIVTSGAQQAVDLALRSLCAPGDWVALPEPVYPAVLSICAAQGLHILPYRVTPDDPACESLSAALEGKRICAIYAQPTFSNPTGETWDQPMRQRFLEICAMRGIPIIEDDPYRSLWLTSPPPPTLLTLSAGLENSTVIWAASLSKTLAPGLRLGWAIVPRELAGPMTALRQAGDLQPNALAQRVAVQYLALDRLDQHLMRVRDLYRCRRDRLAHALERAGFNFTVPRGGMFFFAALPEGANPDGLFERAIARNVLYALGSAFALDARQPGFETHLRLCFTGLDAETLAIAAERLIAAIT